MGAIRGGRERMAVDARGLGTPYSQALWTVLDLCGRRLEIYGSGGWVFESPRARWVKPLVEAVSVRMRLRDLGHRAVMGAILGSHSPSESRPRGRSEVLAHGDSQESALVDLLTLLPPMRGRSPGRSTGMTTDPADLVTFGRPKELSAHANARLTPGGRRILVGWIASGRPGARVAAEMGGSRTRHTGGGAATGPKATRACLIGRLGLTP